jgi:dihydrofolate reductase
MESKRLEISGYAVVGDDDRIADASGMMPDSLKNDAEWEFFQAALDEAEITIIGRRSHDAVPNHKNRLRLVLTTKIRSPETHGNVVYWNPNEAPLTSVLSSFSTNARKLAVVGGQQVFDHFLTGPTRFDHFYLSRIEGVTLPGGRGVFGAVTQNGLTAEEVLVRANYLKKSHQVLATKVTVANWEPLS